MAMFIARLNDPGDGPYPFASDLKCCHVRLTFDSTYVTGGYSLKDIAKMYGINRVQYGICHTVSWINTLTSSGDSMKVGYAEVVETTNSIIIRQSITNLANGDPEITAGLSVVDAVFDMTLFGT